jgi:hypothetical protein
MTEQNYDDATAELGRTAGMDSETVAALEHRLMQAFTEYHSARVAETVVVRSSPWRRWGGAAAVFVVLVAGVATWRVLRATPAGVEVGGVAVASAPPPVAANVARSVVPGPQAVPPKPPRRHRPASRVVRPTGFVALPGSGGLPEFESGTIVRLELSLASLPSYGVDITRAGADRPVEADVLVGQDGQPRAIRLVSSADARTSRSQ